MDTPYTRPVERSGSETLLRIRFLAGYTIDTHESRFSEATRMSPRTS
jgi:hypothetical protein